MRSNKIRSQEKIARNHWSLQITMIYGALMLVVNGITDWSRWLQAAFLIGSTLLMALLNNRYSLIRIYSRMVSCSYLILMVMSSFLLMQTSGNIVSVCWIAMYILMLKTYQERGTRGTILYIFILLGISSTFWVQALFFIPVIWLILAYNLSALSFKGWCASIFGLTLPYWFWGGYEIINGDISRLTTHLCGLIQFGDIADLLLLSANKLITLFFVLILAIIGTIHFLRTSYNDSIKVRKHYEMFIIMDITTIIFIVIQPQYYDILLRLIIINTSILIGHYIALTHTWWTNITFYIILATTLIITVYNTWMPSLTF